MSHATDGSTTGGGAQAARCAKEREKLFAASADEKARLAAETAAYRLKDGTSKFSSSSNAVEVALATATVGLVSKEEFARRRQALEEGSFGDAAASAAASVDDATAAAPAMGSSKEKKKKKKEKSTLSFGFDEEGEDDEAVVVPKKKVKSEHLVSSSSSSAAPLAAAPAPTAEKAEAPAAPPPLPTGCTAVRAVKGGLELSLECYCAASVAKTRVKQVSAMTIAMEVKAKDSEANGPLCAFLIALFAGPVSFELGSAAPSELKCEVIRGQRAPVKVVRVAGCDLSADLAYHKLSIAQQAAAKEAAAAAPPRVVGRPTF